MITRDVGNKRLLKLAEFLETKVPRKQFDMSDWSSGDEDDDCLKPGCGTSGCALGWATAIPSFRRAGLKMRWDYYQWSPSLYHNPPFASAVEFFSLEIEDAWMLFDFPHYDDIYKTTNPTPKQVAKEIRKFVKERTARPSV